MTGTRWLEVDPRELIIGLDRADLFTNFLDDTISSKCWYLRHPFIIGNIRPDQWMWWLVVKAQIIVSLWSWRFSLQVSNLCGVSSLVDSQGSTCAFTESMLRGSGFRTGLFTSPHLLDICERFRFDGLVFSSCLVIEGDSSNDMFPGATLNKSPSFQRYPWQLLFEFSQPIFCAAVIRRIFNTITQKAKVDLTRVCFSPGLRSRGTFSPRTFGGAIIASR